MTSLETMAHQAMEETGLRLAAAIHDARDDKVYFQLCGRAAVDSPPVVITLRDAARRIAEIGETVALAGAASSRLLEHAELNSQKMVRSTVVVPDALWVARLAASRPVTSDVPRPLYLRAPALKPPGPVK
jgi:tRNA A37 threonylcarbamoyladenosine modification protein TsaB